MPDSRPTRALAAAAALADPLRRALHTLVRRSPAPVSRDHAAESLGIARHLASFHLDRLQEAGLLEVEYHRPEGKTGPGAGRPAKYYRSAGDVEVTVPPRRYAFAGSVLARAIGRASRESIPVGQALHEAAAEAGQSLAAAARDSGALPGATDLEHIRAILDDFGYETEAEDGTVTLSNCPFRAMAEEDTELVCGMNLNLLEGLVEGLEVTGTVVRLDPAPGRCCVTLGTS
jgi:predicted ArsR family transcriptional regulator